MTETTACAALPPPVDRAARAVDESVVDSASTRRGGSFEEPEDDYDRAQRTFRRLSAAEAAALRQREPLLSPWRVVRAQAVAGALCVVVAIAVAAFGFGSPALGWSAVYGAAAVVLPSALLARGMTRGVRHAVAAAMGFMFWEMLKIGVSIAMLVIAARVVPHLSWPALLATMVVCMKMNWVALRWCGGPAAVSPADGASADQLERTNGN